MIFLSFLRVCVVTVGLLSSSLTDKSYRNTPLFQPYHVTQTSIDQSVNNDTLKVFFRIYVNDFLKDYRLFCAEEGLDGISEIMEISNENLNAYFNERVHIYINNKLLKGNLVSQSNNGYEMSLSLSFKSEKNPGKFKIQNKALIGVYSDQENLIYLNINNYQEAIKLTTRNFKDSRKLN